MKRRLTRWGGRKVLLPIRKSLSKGTSVEKLSVSLALGLILGLIPLYGLTTVIVAVVAILLRQNFVIMQLTHFLVQPLQLILLVPFLKLGDSLFLKTEYAFTLHQYILLFKNDFWAALNEFWLVNLSAVVIWLIISIPLFIISYYVMRNLITRMRPVLIRVKSQKPL
jgi:uncharacterized protein (DUF2062 family)